MDDRLQFRLDPRSVALKLAAVAFVLVLLNMLSAWLWTDDGLDVVSYRYLNMFDLDEEEGFGTWFSVILLLGAGQLCLLIARRARRAADGLWGYWLVLGLGFHYLSVDEIAGMHEFLNTYGDDLLGLSERWTTYALFGVAALAIAYLPFLYLLSQRGQRKTLALLVLSGFLYVGGAVGAEKLSPSDPELFTLMAYNVGWISLEEGLEMAGVILLIYTLLDSLRIAPQNSVVLEVRTEVPTALPPTATPAPDAVSTAPPARREAVLQEAAR